VEPTDIELLRRWAAGDENAGNVFVERHFSSVYRFFRAKLDVDVEDLTQRTFLAGLEGHTRIREGTSVRAYLLGTARNLLHRYFRDKKKRGNLDDFLAISADDIRDSPSRIASMKEEQKLLVLALRSIPVDHQIAVELYYWEDLPIADVAAVLSIEPGTVKSRLHRARQALRTRLEAMAAGDATVQSTIGDLDKWARSLRAGLGPLDDPSNP
jgi:RNA polymerase sigma-70 factor (ECF subfamily)